MKQTLIFVLLFVAIASRGQAVKQDSVKVYLPDSSGSYTLHSIPQSEYGPINIAEWNMLQLRVIRLEEDKLLYKKIFNAISGQNDIMEHQILTILQEIKTNTYAQPFKRRQPTKSVPRTRHRRPENRREDIDNG